MYEFLTNHELRRDLGSAAEYSNLAVGQLGHVLARVNGSSYDTFSAENAAVIKAFPTDVEGLTYPYPYDIASDDVVVREFIAAYQAKYDELPDLTAADSYDALKMLALAISEVGEDPYAVKEYLLSIEDYHGGSGVLRFDENGDVEKPLLIKQIQNGKFVRIK